MFLASKIVVGWNCLHTCDDWGDGTRASGEAQQDLTPTRKELGPSSSGTRSRRCRKLCATKDTTEAWSMAYSVYGPELVFAHQKPENLPATGQVDSRTADGLGVRPESNRGNSNSAGMEARHGSDRAGCETTQGKPSAYIKWAKGSGRTNKTLRKAVMTGGHPRQDNASGERKTQSVTPVEHYCSDLVNPDLLRWNCAFGNKAVGNRSDTA